MRAIPQAAVELVADHETEEWRPVAGFPRYMVSNHGRVKSVWEGRTRNNRLAGLLKPSPKLHPSGRLEAMRVNLGAGNQRKIHNLVLEAFVGPRPDGMEGCHNDGDPANNHLPNLRWDTHASNMADQVRHGTKSNPPVRSGEKHHNTRLTNDDVRAIRSPPTGGGLLGRLAEKYDVSTQTIWRIRARKVWAHV